MNDNAKICSVCKGKLVECVGDKTDTKQLICASGRAADDKQVQDFKCESCGLKYELKISQTQILKG